MTKTATEMLVDHVAARLESLRVEVLFQGAILILNGGDGLMHDIIAGEIAKLRDKMDVLNGYDING